MYNTIVVGYDESASSKAALKEASLRVKSRNGKLYLVHAVYFDQEEFAILPSQMEKRFEMEPMSAKWRSRSFRRSTV